MNKLLQLFDSPRVSYRLTAVAVVLLVGGVGAHQLFSTHAEAIYYASAQASDGTLAGGASVITDSAASEGKSVQFTGGSGSKGGQTTSDIVVSGVDLHDGTVVDYNGTDYMYGTQYNCGFTWNKANTPFCGFGVSQASTLQGPWSTPKSLFSPSATITANWTGDNAQTWNWVCGSTGAGCFNARMVLTTAGQWLLWFNATGDKVRNANPYWVMTCSGPAGPCANPHKPAVYVPCDRGGDFSIATSGAQGYLICSGTSRNLYSETLAPGWEDGTTTTALIAAGPGEGVGVYAEGSQFEATYSAPNCGYCTGPPTLKAAAPGATEVQIGYATASSLAGPWTAQGVLPGGYVIGQPRTAFAADGQEWEWIDRWLGTSSEAGATVDLVPMSTTP